MVDLEHFFDGYKRNPEFALRAIEAAVVNGASHLVLCDTNGGSLPHEVAPIVGDVTPAGRATTPPSASTATTTPAARSPTRWPPCCAGARHVQGTLNGLGERTGNCNLTTVIPNLQLKLGMQCLPEGRLERLTSVSKHVAEVLNRPLNPQAPYVGHVGVRPQGRPARQRHRAGQGRLRARRPGAGRQRHPLRGQRDGRPGHHRDQGRGARPGDGRPGRQPGDRRPEAPRARGLPLRGRRRLARAADAPGRRLGADVLPGREHAGHHRRAAQRRVHHRGHGEGVGGRRRRRSPRAHGRGQRPRERHRHRRCAPRSAPPTRSSTACTSPTTRCASSTARRPPAPSPGCSSTPPTASAAGPPSGSAATSSRRRGERWRRASCTACCMPPALSEQTEGAMAAPQFAPSPTDRRCPRAYESPPRRPDGVDARPAGRHRRLPARRRAARLPGARPGLRPEDRQRVPPTACSCSRASTPTTPSAAASASALRRASMFSRAPVVHDLTIAFTIWGFLDAEPAGRTGRRCVERLFAGLGPRRPLHRGPRARRHGARGHAAHDPAAGRRRLSRAVARARRRC